MDKTIIKNYGNYLSKVNPEKGRRRAQEQEAKWAEERRKREEEKLTEAYQRELRERAEQAARERRKVEKATAAFNAASDAHGTKSNAPDKRQLREIREGISVIANPTTPFRSPDELMSKKYGGQDIRRVLPELDTKDVINRRYGIGENPNYSNYGYAYKTHDLSDEEKVRQWTNPDYKLSDREKKEAKDILKREKERRNNVIKQGSIDAMIPGTEEYNRLQQYNNLEAKTKGEFARGALLPFLKVSNLATKGVEKLMGDSEDAQNAKSILDEQMQNAFKQDRLAAAQSPVKHGAGNFAGTAAMYSSTSPIFDALAEGLGVSSTVGKFLINQLAQNAQDVALDTAPERQMLRDMGMSEEEINRETLKNVRNNAIGNLAMPVLGKLASTAVDAFKGNLPQLGDSLPKVDMDEFRQGIAKLEDINNEPLRQAAQNGDIRALKQLTEGELPVLRQESVDIPQFKRVESPVKQIEDAVQRQTAEAQKVLKEAEPIEEWTRNQLNVGDSAPTNNYTSSVEKAVDGYREALSWYDNKDIHPTSRKSIDRLKTALDKVAESAKAGDNAKFRENYDEFRRALTRVNENMAEKDGVDYFRDAFKGDINPKSEQNLMKLYDDAMYQKGLDDLDIDEDGFIIPKEDEDLPFNEIEYDKYGRVMLDDEGIPKRRRGVDVGQDIDASISLRNNANMDAEYLNNRLESSPYISKTRTNTIENSGINTRDELDNVVREEYFQRWSRPAQGVYEAAKSNLDNNFDDLVRKYTSNYEIKPKLEKLSNSSKGDLNTIRSDQNIDEMFLVYNRLTQEARNATDPAVKRDLQQKALKVAINVTDAQAENARGMRAQAKWAGTPEHTIITAQGYAGKKVEKALEREPRLADQIKKTSGEIEDWLDKMEVDVLKREEVEDMVANAIRKRDRLKKRVTKEDIGRITDAIMDQRQYADIQRQLEFLSTGFKEVDADTLDKVSDIFERASALNYGSKERVKLENEGYATLAQAIAPEGRPLKEKIDALAYFMMLHRIPTTLRNMKGNIAFGQGIMSVKNAIGGIIEAGASSSLKKHGIDRTKSISVVTDPAMIKKAFNYGINNDYRYMQGGKWETNVGNEINKAIPVYNTKKKTGRIANKVTGGLNDFLEMQDVGAKEVKYATSLAGYLKANGADQSIFDATDKESTQLLERARDYALKQADEATFHQPNETAEKTSQFIRALRESDSPVAQTVGGALHTLQPFIKTPANILKTIGEYRPGLLHRAAMDVYALKKGAKNGKPFTATDFIDDMSKGITGTGAALIGAWLAREGIVRIGYDRSDKEATYDNQVGKKQMAVNINGDWVDIANSVPTSGPLIIGATMYEAAKEYMNGDEDEVLNALFNGIGAVGNSVIETTMLKGISDFIDALRYSDSGAGKVFTAVESILNSRINQIIPADGAALNRSVDPTSYDTYSQYKGMKGTIDRQLKSLQKKIPFSQQIGQSLEQSEIPFLQKVGDRLTLEPYIDAKGNVAKNRGDNVGERLFNNFVNPYSVSTETTDKYDTERERLAKATGDESVLPHISTNSESKLDGTKMSDKEWTTYKQTRGKSREELQHLAIDSDYYKNASDDEKAKLLKNIDEFSVSYGKSVLGGELGAFEQEVADAYKKGSGKDAFNLLLGKAMYSTAGLKSNSKVSGLIADAVSKGDIKTAQQISEDTKAITEAGLTPEAANLYQGAKQKLPKLTPQQFTTIYKAADADGNGSIKQEEIISLMNSDKKNAKVYQDVLWTSEAKKPELIDGSYKPVSTGKSNKSAENKTQDKAEWVRKLNSGEGDIDALIEQNGYKNHVADLYSAAKKRNPNITADEYISAFKAADTNGNGGVTQAEIKALMKRDPQNADRYYSMLWSDKWKKKLK